MERPVIQPIGTSMERLDTPALVVDLDTMERNIEVVHSFFRAAPTKLRPHVSEHKCPAIAQKQMDAGWTVGGISVSRIGEAEVFADAGYTDLLVASEIVTKPKIDRLCSLAGRAKVTVAVDNPRNLIDVSEAAQASGVTIHVLVDVNTALDGCGVEPGRAALDLVKKAASARGLRFAGLFTLEDVVLREDRRDLASDTAKAIQPVLDTRELVERDGLEVHTVSVGGVHDYEIVGAMGGVTEVRVDSYPLMDYNYCQYLDKFRPAAKVLATVISHPIASSAILDVGHKAIGPDHGMPVVDGITGAEVVRLSAEHGTLELSGEARYSLDAGSQVWLVPWDLGLCVNQYNYFNAVRSGKLEAIWEIAARGRFD